MAKSGRKVPKEDRRFVSVRHRSSTIPREFVAIEARIVLLTEHTDALCRHIDINSAGLPDQARVKQLKVLQRHLLNFKRELKRFRTTYTHLQRDILSRTNKNLNRVNGRLKEAERLHRLNATVRRPLAGGLPRDLETLSRESTNAPTNRTWMGSTPTRTGPESDYYYQNPLDSK